MTSKTKAIYGVTGAMIALCALGPWQSRRDPDEEFERRFPGFIETNRYSIEWLSKRPKGDARTKALEVARENLQWAERFKRNQVDADPIAEANESRTESYATTEDEGDRLPPMRSSVY